MSVAKCPVCAWEIKEKPVDVRLGDRVVATCCDECAEKVKAEPAKYAAPR